MRVLENNLDIIVQPWSDPGEFAHVRYSVVDITGDIKLSVSAGELTGWLERIPDPADLPKLLAEYINLDPQTLREEWPRFITDIRTWRIERIDLVAGGWEILASPAEFESSNEIEMGWKEEE